MYRPVSANAVFLTRLFIVCLLFLSVTSTAQSPGDTVFYNQRWDTTTRDQARFFRTGTRFKNGLYTVTDRYINGRPQMTGTFRSLVPEIKQGKFVYYDSLGRTEVEEQFSNGRIEGNRTVYFPGTKSISSRMAFKDNLPNGEAVYYFKASGKVRGKMIFKSGLLQGTTVWYYANGKAASKSTFKSGDSLALLTQYDTTGTVVFTVPIDRNNQYQGTRKFYYAHSDILKVELQFVNDTPNGSIKYYDFTCGSVIQQGIFRNGKKEGVWRFYNKCDTTLYATNTYRNDIKEGMALLYDAASKMIVREGMDSAGLEVGEWRYYFPGTRKLSMVRHYKAGVLDGELTTYYPNGNVRRREIFADGTKTKWNCYSTTGADTIYYARYAPPEYPENFRSLLARQIEYPERALGENLRGAVSVMIYIDAKGSIYNAEIAKSTNPVFNDEAVRVAMTLPIFSPAREDGEPIETYLTIPVEFSPDNFRAPAGDF